VDLSGNPSLLLRDATRDWMARTLKASTTSRI